MREVEVARGAPWGLGRLADLKDAPARIFVEGEPSGSGPKVAIVGARRASERGRTLAYRLARDLARAGVVVVSGGAIGIDAEAHRGALDGGGTTWVVLPTPISAPAPRQNRQLFDEILRKGGVWLSEHSDTRVLAAHFVERNRLIAALAEVVVVVEAALRSGTRATAAKAKQLGRPVGAVPWAVGDEGGAGCLWLLRQGARLVVDAGDVLELMGRPWHPACDPPVDGFEIPLSGATAEDLAQKSGRSLSEVLAALSRLEIAGQVRAAPGGRFIRA